MESIILYASQYGTSEKYAEKLSEITGIKAVSYDKEKDINKFERVIYLGGLYAGGVKGLKRTLRHLGSNVKFTLITVGLADVSNEENIENIRNSLRRQLPQDIYGKTEIFHLRGGIDYSNLNVKHKIMMKLLYKSVKKTPAEKRTAEAADFLETYNKKTDFVDYDMLIPIAEFINKG